MRKIAVEIARAESSPSPYGSRRTSQGVLERRMRWMDSSALHRALSASEPRRSRSAHGVRAAVVKGSRRPGMSRRDRRAPCGVREGRRAR